ncbi:MAG: tetratricopeptide repeat protein [Anaerolineae bacterium]|nr:tetratricopeptide repeat protein [Anaerolineae bacterium]
MKRPVAFFILILSSSALACNFLSEPAPIIVTATPMGGVEVAPPINPNPNPGESVVITATPEPTPTLAPVPTATLPPDEGLFLGERALHNGNYQLAVNNFAAILRADFIDPSLRAEAAYKMGEAALREALFSEALSALDVFLAGFPQDERVPLAHFLRGEAHLGLGNWEAAIADLQTYLERRPGIIDSYALERIGDAQMNLGQITAALDTYKRAAEASRTLEAQLALREKVATAYLNAGLVTEAIAQYDAILTEAQNAPYRANIEYQAARLEINSGQAERGVARLRAMLELYPTTRGAYLAMIDLLNGGATIDDWLRARISFANEDYADTATTLERYVTNTPHAPQRGVDHAGPGLPRPGQLSGGVCHLSAHPRPITPPTPTLAWAGWNRAVRFLKKTTIQARLPFILRSAAHAPTCPKPRRRCGGRLTFSHCRANSALPWTPTNCWGAPSPRRKSRTRGCSRRQRWPTPPISASVPAGSTHRWPTTPAAACAPRRSCGWGGCINRTARRTWHCKATQARRRRPPANTLPSALMIC